MKRYLLFSLAFASLLPAARAQKKVLTYPFQFEKSFLAKGQYSTYFLDNPDDDAFSLILKDNKKAEYVWLGKDFHPIAKVSSPIENTLLDNQKHKYIGGTAKGAAYHFIYQSGTEFDMETVDYNAHTVSDKKILDLPRSEKVLASFSDYNVYYCLATDDKADNLVIYTVNSDGALTRREIAFPIPPTLKSRLTEYLRDLTVLKSAEEPELGSAAHINKLFSRRGQLVFVLNVRLLDVRVFSIDTRDFSVRDNDFDETALLGPQEKGGPVVMSFLKDSTLYSFALGKTVRVGIQRLPGGEVINKFEFFDDAAFSSFAGTPLRETRYIRQVETKDLDTWKKFFKTLKENGLAVCMVSLTGNGDLLFTGGAFMHLTYSTGSNSHYMGGFDHTNTTNIPNIGPVPTYNPYMYRVPGGPSFAGASSPPGMYYMSTHFDLLLDPVTLKTVKGQPRRPVVEQIRDYMYAEDRRAKAPNQFAIGNNQYYGYYDQDAQQYVIEQIPIR
jgi:hypothetical protein